METENDQVIEESPLEEEVQDEQSEETPETADVEQEQAQELQNQQYKALQKGYTQQAQQLAELRRELEALKEQETTPATAEDIPQTYEEMEERLVNRLKGELTAPQREQQKIEEEINQMVSQDLDTLYMQGKIKTEQEENEFIDWAVKKLQSINENLPPDQQVSLRPIAMYPLYEEYKNALRKGDETKAKKEVQQEAGSQVGKSSRVTEAKGNGPSYKEIHNTDLMNL